jgi:hypothetical protein
MLWWLKFYELRDENKDGEGGGGSGNPDGEPEGNEDPAPEGEGDDGGEPDGELKLDALPPAAQKHIKKLRDEAAKYRQKARDSGEKFGKVKKVLVDLGLAKPEEDDPQETIKGLTAINDETTFRNGILEAALEHGIPKDGLEYFNFLVEKKAKALGEDEELDDDAVSALAAEVKEKFGSPAPTKSGAGSNNKPAPNGGSSKVPTGDLTAEKFATLSNGEQTELYKKNPDLFGRLAKEARTKRLLTRRG